MKAKKVEISYINQPDITLIDCGVFICFGDTYGSIVITDSNGDEYEFQTSGRYSIDTFSASNLTHISIYDNEYIRQICIHL